jgi:uncharacterized membrane protein YfcA
LDLGIWILTAIVVFGATLIMSVAGFGFGLVATPLLFLFLDPKTVVLFSASLGSIVGILVLIQARKSATPRIITILGISCLIGLPVGIYMLSTISAPILKIIIGSMVIIFALLLALGYSIRIKRENVASGISGFIGGALMTGTGLGGPPVILFLINQAHEKQVFRANLAGYFIISGIASFATLGISGTVSGSALIHTLTFIPVVILAYFIGIRILPFVKQNMFRKIVLTIIFLAGIAGIITAIMALIR